MKSLPLYLLLSLPLVAADSVVTLNEIHYNPKGGSQDQEWIELYNQMAINVDLSGWRLTGGIDFTIPKGTTIPGGGYLVIAKNPANPALAGAEVVGPFEGALSNGGDTLRLRASSERIMDELNYGDSDQWPVGPDGSGATLAKIEGSLLSGKSSSWMTSPKIGGTPGAVNLPEGEAPIAHVLVATDASWKYLDTGAQPASTWQTTAFNDEAWDSGTTLFGTTSAGGGPVILPVTDSLVERFRASDLSLSDGQTVSTWPDTATDDGQTQSASATGNPSFAANATPSGQPAVRFDGNDQLRTSIAPGIAANSGFVYFAVLKANATPSSGAVTDGSGTYLWDRDISVSDPPLTSLKSVGGRFGFQTRYDNNSGLGGPVSSSSISTSQYQIVAIRRKTSSSQFELWVDGVRESTAGDTGAGLTPQPIVIGSHSGGGGGFNGEIAELLIYSDELTDAQFESVGAYLEAQYGLDTEFPGNGAAPTTELTSNGQTSYLRQSFNFNGNPDNTSIRLNHLVGDGAVVYLNGVEVQRINMPAGAITHDSRALSEVDTPSSSGFITLTAPSLQNGVNVLAISLHPSAGNSSVSFAATLEGTETPSDPEEATGLVFHEVSPAGDGSFFVELKNQGTTAISTSHYALEMNGTSISLPETTLTPGGLLLLDQAVLNTTPTAGDKLFLYSSNGATLSDARLVTNRLRGLSTDYPKQWLFPSSATPGSTNAFDFADEIVINEICYNPPILNASPGVPPTIVTNPLVTSGATWRYNEAGEALPSDWASQAHPTGGNWKSGASPLAFDRGINVTNLTNPSSNFPSVVTYYFETEVNLTAQEASTLETLNLNHFIDDGAIFYLNGVELDRFQMPQGEVSSSTFASTSVGDAAWSGDYSVSVPPGAAVAGVNRFSVEVHQITLGSSDIAFDFEASAAFVTDQGIPAQKSRPGDTQWIELYNRSNQSVDLSDWDFGEGINYTFPDGTILAADSYLVISNDPATLAEKHPGITILGPFGGSLSRRSETLTLRDAFNNPVDSLRYYDGGAWPSKADAGGSTMELIDPQADNSLPGAWRSSDELTRTSWKTYRFRATASASPVGNDNQWKEFVLGLLEEGEILIDDLSVIENPDGAAVSMLQNGDFDSLAQWRALGNHRDVAIIPDPDGDGNVLYLKAIGSTEHQHNHLETTLASGRSVVNGREYEVSFRARWLSGNHLLHTRLYFNRIPHTFQLERPETFGTPGGPNSTLVDNAGPTSRNLSHSPVVPAAGEPVEVQVEASDPDGVQSLILNYRVEGGAFNSTPMTTTANRSIWKGTIPGQSAGRVVQFYLTATDSLGATSEIPAQGADSRAMYEVEDGRAATTGNINNFRIVMDPNDLAWMFTPRNLMSNGRVPCTVIDQERKAYYNAGVRIKGSERARGQVNRVGFNVGFPSDQLYRNVHRSVAIDRSEGQVVGQRELLFDLMATSSGGIPGEFNDLAYVISPNPAHTSAAVLQLARFGSVFLEDQFEDGSDGTVYEYELVYYPTSTDAGGYKIPEPDQVARRDINNMGDDPEAYRWTYLIKNNQEFDDYQPAMALGKQFSKSTADFNASVADVLDVDQWLRALAYSCATGAGDSFYANSNHNGQFYGRPDGKILYFPHDLDFSFSASRSIFESSELNRIISNQAYRRAYLAHLYDICSTVYNQAWMQPWTTHLDAGVPGGNVFTDDLSYINSRSNYILSQINSQVASTNFAITTNGGNNFTTSDSPVELSGNGWLDIHEIRLASSGKPLEINWASTNSWTLSLPLSPGANPIILEAYDREGNLLDSDSISITSNATSVFPNPSNLVISEIYYNPPGQDEESEYLELMNISDLEVDLSLSFFSAGIDFTFPVGTTLLPGARTVIVRNQAAFEATFGRSASIAGAYTGGLNNGGELLTLNGSDGIPILSFSYGDSSPWPPEADGDGYSLVLIAPETAPNHDLAAQWQASLTLGGSPGTTDTLTLADWKVEFGNPADDADPDHDGWSVAEEFYFGGSPTTRDALSPSFALSSELGTTTLTIARRAGVEAQMVLESSKDLMTWAAHPSAQLISKTRSTTNPELEILSFSLPLEADQEYYRFQIEE